MSFILIPLLSQEFMTNVDQESLYMSGLADRRAGSGLVVFSDLCMCWGDAQCQRGVPPRRCGLVSLRSRYIGITPNVGDVHYRGPSSGVLDPLLAKAIVFRQGREQAALVFCGLIGISICFRELVIGKW